MFNNAAAGEIVTKSEYLILPPQNRTDHPFYICLHKKYLYILCTLMSIFVEVSNTIILSALADILVKLFIISDFFLSL